MASPTGSITFNKTAYKPGEVMTATVAYADADTSSGTGRFTLTDSGGNVTLLTAAFVVSDPVTVTVTAGNDRTWTKVVNSDTGSTVQFTATA